MLKFHDERAQQFNPLLHRYSFLRLLQQTTFENIVTKEETAPTFFEMFSKLSNLKTVHFCQLSEHSKFILMSSAARLLYGGRVKRLGTLK